MEWIVTLFSWIAAALPFSLVRSLADALAADGSMDRMTPSFWGVLRVGAFVVGLLFLALCLWHRKFPASYNGFFASLRTLPARFLRDLPSFWRDLRRFARPTRKEGFVVLLIFFSGALLRFLYLDQPLYHDEAYSMAIWGRSDLYFAVSDYHLPNNHLFHSVLVNLVYHFLGKEIWMLRLPVFLAGLAIIPTAWLLGKRLRSREAGILAAGLCAFAPYLTAYSVNARGYEIQAALTLASVLLALYLKGRKNLFGWGLLVLFSGLNFFTLPVALYPFGGICVWFLLDVLLKRVSPQAYPRPMNFFKYLIACGLCVTILTFVLHLPLFKESGFESYFGNQYVGAVIPGTFIQTSLSRLLDSFHAFCDGWPIMIWAAILLGNILILLAEPSRREVPYQAGLFICMAVIIVFQKPNLWPRTLLFLHPLLIVWGACGLCRFAGKAVLFLCALMIFSAGISQFPSAIAQYGVMGADERAVRRIQELEGGSAGDVFLITAAEDNAPIWIYADALGLPEKVFDKNAPFGRVYAFYNPKNDAFNAPSDLDSLLADYSPGQNFFNRDTQEIVMEDPDGILYRYQIIPSAIEKAFGRVPEMKETK